MTQAATTGGQTNNSVNVMASSGANDIIIEAWNTVLFDKYLRYKHLFTEGLATHSEHILSRRSYQPGMKILDIGCGFGDSTVNIAKAVGKSCEVTGMDCSERFIAAAKQDAAEGDVKNVRYFAADAATDDLGGPYDEVFSRFGTMFFNLPGIAMKNIRQTLKPGGKFTQVVWRKREDNAWLHDAEKCVKKIVPVISHDETDAVHCGPGPFSMAGPDMVSEMLQIVGFEGISFERFDTEIMIGKDIDEAIDFTMTYGPAGEIIRLAGEEGERLKPEVRTALRKVLSGHVREDKSVWAPSSSWIITAYNPRKSQ
jgi:ubiquinone/menaquinone biosynthesis C-methylase UbiE